MHQNIQLQTGEIHAMYQLGDVRKCVDAAGLMNGQLRLLNTGGKGEIGLRDMDVHSGSCVFAAYIIKRLTCEEIIVHPNIRVQKYLSSYLVELTEQLQRLERLEQNDDVLGNIQYLLELISKMTPEPVR